MHQNQVVPKPLRLLVVEDNDLDAQQIDQVIQRESAGVTLHRVSSLAQACSRLADTQIDVILVNHELPDGDCFDLMAFLLDKAIMLPVIVLTRYGHEDIALSAMKAGASDCIRKELDQRHLDVLPIRLQEALFRHRARLQAFDGIRRQEHLKMIETLRAMLATVMHDINNPLSIISGNAQLLLELTQLMEGNDDLVKAIRDIEEARMQVTDSLDILSRIKEHVLYEFLKGEHNGARHNGNGISKLHYSSEPSSR
jgi:DNA-binding response OmpR family regulator